MSHPSVAVALLACRESIRELPEDAVFATPVIGLIDNILSVLSAAHPVANLGIENASIPAVRSANLRAVVVDDDPLSRLIVEEQLVAEGHQVLAVDTAARAMFLLEREPIDLLIADWVMPDITGIDLCKWTRNRPLPRTPHVVIVTAQNDRECVESAFAAGADDFLFKPFETGEFVARLRAWTRTVQLQNELATRHREATRLTSELISVNQRLGDLSSRDELTGLHNRREAMRRLTDELKTSSYANRPMTIAIIDVDDFKICNDTLGHPAGDSLLRHVASLLVDTTRVTDGVYRLGGDEFLVLLPSLTLPEAQLWAARLKEACASRPLPADCRGFHLSFSIGLAQSPHPSALVPLNLHELLELADQSLYAQKAVSRAYST